MAGADGQPGRHAAPAQFSDLDQWYIGKPDIVVTNEKPYMLPATGPDNIVDMLVDPGFKEDMYIMAIESKPADAAELQGRRTTSRRTCRRSGRRSDGAVLERVRARQERRHLPAELRAG